MAQLYCLVGCDCFSVESAVGLVGHSNSAVKSMINQAHKKFKEFCLRGHRSRPERWMNML